MKISPTLLADVYKLGHPDQYPKNTQFVYSNTTPRSSRLEGVNEVVVFGNQYFIKEYLVKQWNEGFFNLPKEEALKDFIRISDHVLGKGSISPDRMGALHDLGYLPLKLKSLPEGTLCPIGVPHTTIVNTLPEFFWLTNMIETINQTVTWQPLTSATIAHQYRLLLDKYADETSDQPFMVDWQAHDFSMRGMSSLESACVSGAAHLLSFTGTDSIPAILFLEEYYGADIDNDIVGGSVPATEHSVMCAGGENDELETYRRLLEDVYPSGIVSIVSDTWDYWHILTNTLLKLKELILSRDGKLVIRPDSGDPVKIVCGYDVVEITENSLEFLEKNQHKDNNMMFFDGNDAIITWDGKYFDIHSNELTENQVKGSIELLWETFGGEINSKGYKQLDSHIGLIYGDSITIGRCEQICEGLKKKGFSSTNVVFGVGSFTYQYNTRDTFSIACKATHVIIDGVPKAIFKDPKTDNGTKKSAKGYLRVDRVDGRLILRDGVTPEEESGGELVTVFEDGKIYNESSLKEIRDRVKNA
ncbi:MAG: nicotinate phosphoribosyltransferase [Roseovarius sp.]